MNSLLLICFKQRDKNHVLTFVLLILEWGWVHRVGQVSFCRINDQRHVSMPTDKLVVYSMCLIIDIKFVVVNTQTIVPHPIYLAVNCILEQRLLAYSVITWLQPI